MLFVTATDTDVGKTYFSKTFINYLIENAHYKKEEIAYFKPIQCGTPTDYEEVAKICGVDVYTSYDLAFPASPDYASSLENISIEISKIKDDYKKLCENYKFVLVEGAGGVAVPINEKNLVSDLAKALDIDTVLVTRPDLGTINHSINAIEHLKNKGVKLKGFYVSAKTRDLSEAYDIAKEEKDKQNSAALESIIKFTKINQVEFPDLK